VSIIPEEQRITRLLRELVQQSGVPAEVVETRLGWEPGRLGILLSQGIGFENLLDVLAELDITPGDFFARLNESNSNGNGGAGGRHGRGEDRRFEESRRVVKDALARRSAWKKQQETGRGST
jgi:hypothetical protein